MSHSFLLYGANGYTGRLILERALQLGMRPVVAGRNGEEIRALAAAHGLEHAVFELEDAVAVDAALASLPAVLNAAGPFSRTAAPLVHACIRTRTHYLDITGELPVFEWIHGQAEDALAAGVMLLPGVGFDVVPTDLLAAHLRARLPGAVRLRLAFQSLRSGISRGTATTMIENVDRGGAVREDGRIIRVPAAWRSRTVEFGFGTRPTRVTTIPWGDVATAYYSTGIPDIRVYTRVSRLQRLLLIASRRLGRVLRAVPAQRLLKAWVRARAPGPDEQQRARAVSLIWGEVEDGDGNRAEARMRTPEAYTLTALTAVEAMRRTLAGDAPAGFQTPSLAWGADWVLELEGVEREDFDRGQPERADAGDQAAADVAPPSGRWQPRTTPCLNCGNATPGRYCPECGQRKTIVQVSVGTLVGDVARDELMLNSALPRTVAALMLHPGRLTTEYIRGRIVRYIPPLRLYLVSSVLFFVALSFVGLKALERVDATIGAAVTADSVRAVLTQRQAELQDRLEAGDTAGRSAAERARLLRDIASTETALAALADTLLSGTPERRAGLLRMATAEGAMPRGTMQPWAVELGRGEAPGLLEPILDRKLAQVGHLPWHEAGRQVLADLLDYAPHMVFLLLPVFTLLLKLLYIRRGRYYAEHFVFALHLHAFFFLMFFIMLVLPWNEADRFLILWMLAYVWLAMKRVYGQGWFRTTVKWWALGWSYMLVLALGLVGLSTLALLYL